MRLWCSATRIRALAARLSALPAPPGGGPLVSFFGSGDYHHLTTALLQSTPARLTVVHFDNHPDWVRIPPTHNCGGWVNRALDLPNVERVITLGVASGDLALPQFKTANLAALDSGRLEIHPWRAAPSRIWGQVKDGFGHRMAGGRLVWRCIEDEDREAFVDSLAARIPTDEIWITIDKDVLRPADAATNWDQGEMPLDALLDAIRRLARRRRVAGVDICGEYSPPKFRDPLKFVAAWLDRPDAKPVSGETLQRNDLTNRAIVETLEATLQ